MKIVQNVVYLNFVPVFLILLTVFSLHMGGGIRIFTAIKESKILADDMAKVMKSENNLLETYSDLKVHKFILPQSNTIDTFIDSLLEKVELD